MINVTKKENKVYFLTATFNRQALTRKSISDLEKQNGFHKLDSEIWVIEAGDYDKTYDSLKDIANKNLKLIKAPENTFWSSAMSIGIDQISKDAKPDDIIICFNNDITVPDQILANIITQITNQARLVISPLSVSPYDERVIATGVIVKNWYFGINETPFNGRKYDQITNTNLIEVDYMTQRLMAFRAGLIFESGNYNSKWLPHYGGDYEFTFRAKSKGYSIAIDPKMKIYIDERETGLNPKYRKLTFIQRLFSLFSVRSSNNLLKNIKFSLLTAPLRAQPLNLIALIAKSLILALLASPRSK